MDQCPQNSEQKEFQHRIAFPSELLIEHEIEKHIFEHANLLVSGTLPKMLSGKNVIHTIKIVREGGKCV